MQTIQISDQAFDRAQRAAGAVGLEVDRYLENLIVQDQVLDDDTNRLFTPARLAQIDKADADVRAGRFLTSEQAKKAFAANRAEWRQENQV